MGQSRAIQKDPLFDADYSMIRKRLLISLSYAALVAAPLLCSAQSAIPVPVLPHGYSGYACELSDLQAGSRAHERSQVSIACHNSAPDAPVIFASGHAQSSAGAPLLTTAHYTLVPQIGHVGQPQSGSIHLIGTSTLGLAKDLESHLAWDAATNTLSIQYDRHAWQTWQVARVDGTGDWIHPAGYSSRGVQGGQTNAYLDFGLRYSRFSPRTAPRVEAIVVVQDGVLRVDPVATSDLARTNLEAAFAALDRSPSDMQLAWSAAALAQYLSQPELVQLAAKKVAAYHPQNLREFQMDLAKIQDFELPHD